MTVTVIKLVSFFFIYRMVEATVPVPSLLIILLLFDIFMGHGACPRAANHSPNGGGLLRCEGQVLVWSGLRP